MFRTVLPELLPTPPSIHTSLQLEKHYIGVHVEDSLPSPIPLDERQQTPALHTNNNTGDTTPSGHFGHLQQSRGGKDDIIYEDVSQGTAAKEVVYTDDRSALKKETGRKGINESYLLTVPWKTELQSKIKSGGWRKNRNEDSESAYELYEKELSTDNNRE